MGDVIELDLERTKLDGLPGFNRVEQGIARMTPLRVSLTSIRPRVRAVAYTGAGMSFRTWWIAPIWSSCPCVMTNADHLIGSAAHIFIIGNDIVDPEHVVFGEHDAGVDDDDLAIEFVGGHVLSNFPKSTQGNDLQFSVLSHTNLFFPHLFNKIYLSAIGG